jgi:hypothetical protein
MFLHGGSTAQVQRATVAMKLGSSPIHCEADPPHDWIIPKQSNVKTPFTRLRQTP